MIIVLTIRFDWMTMNLLLTFMVNKAGLGCQLNLQMAITACVVSSLNIAWAWIHLNFLLNIWVCLLYFLLYLSISIVLLTAWAFQKRSRPQQLTLWRSLHADALQATVSEGLAQGPYMAARAGFETKTLRSKGIDPTNAPPGPISKILF